MTRPSRLGAIVLACGLGACAERQASGSRAPARDTAGLESGRVPISVTLRGEPGADGRSVREVLVRAERGSERWFEHAGRELRLEVGGRRSSLSPRPGGLGARWVGGPGVLSWVAPDGSAGLRIELADLSGGAEWPPRFEALPPTGLVEVAVPVGGAP